ncbi:unnamed protein product, partial [Brugia timori]
MGANTFIAIAIAISACAIVATLFVVVSLFNDINALYDNAMNELHDFKIIANDTWNTIRLLHIYPSRNAQIAPTYANLFIRHKREPDPESCKCCSSANHCPRGPAGPQGNQGWKGVDGLPGEDGYHGVPSVIITVIQEKSADCIYCPPGPPGLLG